MEENKHFKQKTFSFKAIMINMWLTCTIWQLQQHSYLSVPALRQRKRSAENSSTPHGSAPDPTEVMENLPSMLAFTFGQHSKC